MKSQSTLKDNTKKCEKQECLEVEIFQHASDIYTYIVWNGKHLVGQLVEDSIMKLLDKKQLKDFYSNNTNVFVVTLKDLQENVKQPSSRRDD